MKPQQEFDIVIAGGGLVGAAFALAMAGSGLRMALVESAPPPELPPDESWDSRVYAISPGNADFLAQLGAWQRLEPQRLTPILAMQVWGDDGRSRIGFDAYAAGAEALGYIVEGRQLQTALWRELESCGSVAVFSPASAESLHFTEQAAMLRLDDRRTLDTQLLVGADGGNSAVRRLAGIGASARGYGQLGVVANFLVQKPHGNVARQWFRRDGVLAWLPLPGNRISMVWSAAQAQAEELLVLDGDALCERVADAGGHALGALQLITAAAGFPLRLQNAAALIMPRLALVGDAAHLVHPLAGQGVNLGFRDALCLADVLLRRGTRADPGDYLLLRRYERARKADVFSMQAATDGLQRLFNNDRPALAALRNMGLEMVDRQGWLKRRLMTKAMA